MATARGHVRRNGNQNKRTYVFSGPIGKCLWSSTSACGLHLEASGIAVPLRNERRHAELSALLCLERLLSRNLKVPQQVQLPVRA